MLKELLDLLADVNPAEIASHIAQGNLHDWCISVITTKLLSSHGRGIRKKPSVNGSIDCWRRRNYELSCYQCSV